MPSSSAEDSATLYTNARVYTQASSLPWAEAMLVLGGRVRWVGREAELGSGVAGRRVDLGGATVLPALADAHTHFVWYGLLRGRVDLRPARSLEEALAMVAAYGSSHPDAIWIQGHGWNENIWERPELPDRARLDAVTDRPAVLSRADGHMLWANTLALKVAGIGAATADPSGGQIDRDATGEPTGILRDNAMALVQAKAPPPGLAERLAGLRAAQAEAHALGIAAVHTMEGGETIEALQVLRHAGELRLRVLALPPVSLLPELRTAGLRSGFGDEWVRLGQLKLFADGSLGSRTAWMLEPFEGEPGNLGLATTPPDTLTTLVREAHAAGWACAIHAIGDAANRAALDAFAAAPAAELALPDRIEHVQLIRPEDMARFAHLGVVASMQPVHVSSDWRVADRLWGDRARWSYAWRSLAAAGAALAFGSDAPVEPLNPWAGLQVAITRRDLAGMPAEGWYREERLTLAEAIAGFTTGVARAAGSPLGGMLAPHCPADFIVLERDPFTLAPEESSALRPLRTVIDGVTVFEA